MNIENFSSFHYDRHNKRRLEHLASLRLNVGGKSVLEVGAGVGDHTSFFIDRGCRVTCTDARKELLNILIQRYPFIETYQWNIESKVPKEIEMYGIVYAYGILYHTKKPDVAIQNISKHCDEMLLLETCVSYGDDTSINIVNEFKDDPTQAIDGYGCRPTRNWVFNELKKHFPFVYNTLTQPAHEEFPLNWNTKVEFINSQVLARSIFVASRNKITNEYLIPYLVNQHIRL
jgi:hypothetical protein